MPATVTERIRNAGRINQILTVAMRYGFQQIVQQVQAARRGLLKRIRPVEGAPDPKLGGLGTGERLRRMLEELGPTFVKLGQLLSTRPDLMPAWAVEELVKLQDRLPPMSFELVRLTVEGELNAPLEQLFAEFSPQPLGSASLGQVHRAVLHTGEVVAVKVQRPGIDRTIERDLSVLNDLVGMLESRVAVGARMKLARAAQELSERLRDELIYTIEARNAERVAQTLSPEDGVRIPKVYWNLTSPRVLTCELFEAVRFTEPGGPPAALRPELARRLARFALRQILVEGFFHADLHPGNLMAFDNGDLGVIDWGQVGLLSRRMRESLDEIFVGLATRDTERLTDEIVHLGLTEDNAELEGFRYDLSRALDRYYHVPRSDYPLGSILRTIMDLSYEHNVQLPAELPMLIKVLVAVEGTCLSLDPEFDLRREFEPVARQVLGRQLSPEQLLRTMLASGRQLSRLAQAFPRQMTTIMDRMEAGTLALKVNTDVEEPGRHLGQMLNRLSLSAIVGGLMVAGALAMPYSPALGVGTFCAGVLAAMAVLFAILRGERL
ncbi:MAG: phosphotransferase [Armatimonadetes bacterium]|nr:phosphotransferase [Armatimonadota bacterium]